jgi:hypothetical protein
MHTKGSSRRPSRTPSLRRQYPKGAALVSINHRRRGRWLEQNGVECGVQECDVSIQKRLFSLVVFVVSIVFILACQSISGISATATPAMPLGSMSYDGKWKGKTSQGLEITFTVAYNGIIAMKFQADWQSPNCTQTLETGMETTIDPTSEAMGNFTPIHVIENGTFTIAEDNSSVNGASYTFTGAFSSPERASGTIEYAVPTGSCKGTKRFGWTATKISE